MIGAEAIVRMLEADAVRDIFGRCGDTHAAVASALKEAVDHDGPTLVNVISQPLHEAGAPVTQWIT